MKQRITSRAFTLALVAPIFLAAPADAQCAEIDELRALIVENAGLNIYPGSQTFSLGSNIFQAIDKNDNGITSDEIAAQERILNALLRAEAAGQILRYDLNADLKIEKAEVEEYFRQTLMWRPSNSNKRPAEEALRRQEEVVMEVFQSDLDKSGIIEGEELFIPAPKNAYVASFAGAQQFSIKGAKLLLKPDPNKDGIASHSEALTLFGQALDGVNIFLEINKRRQPIIEGGKF